MALLVDRSCGGGGWQAVVSIFREDLATLYRAVSIKLIERLLALREHCTRLAAPDEDAAASAAAAITAGPAGITGPLSVFRRLVWDPRPPTAAACRREFEVAGWDALVHRAWCRAAVSGRAGDGSDSKISRVGGSMAATTGSEGWLWVFEDAWVFRPAATRGHRFRFSREDMVCTPACDDKMVTVTVHSRDSDPLSAWSLFFSDSLYPFGLAALFPHRWTAISADKAHPCAWLAGGSDYSHVSQAHRSTMACSLPTGDCRPEDAEVGGDIAAAAAAGAGRLTRRSSARRLAQTLSFSRRRASANSDEPASGLEGHFLRLLGAKRLEDVHPECLLREFRPGESVFVRDDVGDAQPFAFVARGIGVVVAPGGDVLDVVRPGSFFGSTQFIQQDSGILPGVRMIAGRATGADVILLRPEWIWARMLQDPGFHNRFYRFVAQDLSVRFRRQFGLKYTPLIQASPNSLPSSPSKLETGAVKSSSVGGLDNNSDPYVDPRQTPVIASLAANDYGAVEAHGPASLAGENS